MVQIIYSMSFSVFVWLAYQLLREMCWKSPIGFVSFIYLKAMLLGVSMFRISVYYWWVEIDFYHLYRLAAFSDVSSRLSCSSTPVPFSIFLFRSSTRSVLAMGTRAVVAGILTKDQNSSGSLLHETSLFHTVSVDTDVRTYLPLSFLILLCISDSFPLLV